jgi:hypothetical protein
VLFIGNSYTFVNNLPDMFARLARAGGHPVETGMAATGGWTLADHLNSSATLDTLGSEQWNFVVLQEQSQVPSIPLSRGEVMYPAARSLAGLIEANGATPLFFITWAHRDGWPENGMPDYASMQTQIDYGYEAIAQELSLPLAPVGPAWSEARQQDPQLDLWQSDGSHPVVQGTYLAACVFYAVIFRQSPQGLAYRAGLPGDAAGELQTIADQTVLKDPAVWLLH